MDSPGATEFVRLVEILLVWYMDIDWSTYGYICVQPKWSYIEQNPSPYITWQLLDKRPTFVTTDKLLAHTSNNRVTIIKTAEMLKTKDQAIVNCFL